MLDTIYFMKDNTRIFEFIQITNNIKVSAVDPITGLEVIMIFPLGLSQQHMMEAANKKLDYVLSKKNKENNEHNEHNDLI